MCVRDEVDKRNANNIKNIVSNYPIILSTYINSLSNRTSYTKLVYSRYMSHFLDYLRDEIKIDINNNDDYKKVKPMDVGMYLEKIKYNNDGTEKSISYMNVQLAAIKGFFEFLFDNEIILNNPCKKMKAIKDNRIHDITVITDEDYKIMLDNIKNGVGNHRARALQKKWVNRDIAMLTLGVTTGLRVSAIVGINIDDIDFNNNTVRIIEKGNREKIVILGSKAIKDIKKWITDRKKIADKKEQALFICKTGKRMSTVSVEERFRKIAKGTGKKITPHKMRATCATRLYEATGDIYLVQDQLGHKNIENTKKYAKVSEKRKMEAANILNDIF